MSVYYTSDLHFNHAKICEYEKRPWNTVQEMNEGLIQNWNAVVDKDSIVYCLGDFCFHPRADIPEIRKRLNGHIVLVYGNHDNVKKQPDFYKCFDDVVGSDVVEDEIDGCAMKLFLHHEPIPESEWRSFARMNLCGHVHGAWVDAPGKIGLIMNVGVDVCDYRPMTFQSLMCRPFRDPKPVDQRVRDFDPDNWEWDAGPGKKA